MSHYHLAQINIARMQAPLDSPQMADFVANLDRINLLAETSPGFIWRLKTDDGDATALRPLDESTIVNMSVWTDLAALNQFVFRSAHVEIMRRRKEWFERMKEAYVALWWIKKGHIPSIDEALEKLEHLRVNGPSPTAFNYRQPFAAPDEIDAFDSSSLIAECPT
jgi:hypothetical protein